MSQQAEHSTPAQAPAEGMTTHDAAAAHGEAGAIHDDAAYSMPHEVPNVATLIEASTGHMGAGAHHEPGVRPHPGVYFFINPLFSIFYCLVLVWIVRKALRGASVRNPGRLQNAVESVLGGLRNFFLNIMGPEFDRHVPFICTLWLFIWMNNVMVLVPGLKSANSSFPTTIALAIVTIIYARYHNIRALGFLGYLHHLAGSPQGALMWCLSPLFFLLELMGEIIKPLSLGLRLFGNIFGEDKLLAVFLGLGMMLMASLFNTATPWIGVPLHLPFFFMVVLLSTIQAFVFTLLASIYLQLMMPHEHEHEHGHDAGHPDEAHAALPAATV